MTLDSPTPLYRGLETSCPVGPPPIYMIHSHLADIHAVNREDVAGCAFAIAYKSDPYQVTSPSLRSSSKCRRSNRPISSSSLSSTIASLVRTSPSAFPTCPPAPTARSVSHSPSRLKILQCMCSWFWIHKSIGGTDQMVSPLFPPILTALSST